MYKINLKKLIIPIAVIGSLFFSQFEAKAQISSVTVTVNDSSSTNLPTVATTSASLSSFCTGTSTVLSITGGHLGSGTPTADWKWYEDACPTAAATAIGTGASITVSPQNLGLQPITKTYYVRAEGGFCNYTTACIPVTVTINPIPVVSAPSAVVACAGNTVPSTTLVGTPSGVTYDISGGATVGLADATGLTSIPSFTALNTGTAPVTVTVTITPKANGCIGTAVTYTITVNPAATVNAVADITKCNGNTVASIPFSSPSTGGTVTYAWTNDNTATGLAASGTGDIASFTATNSTCTDIVSNITVTPTIANGGQTCPGTPITFKITVRPTPNGSITAVGATLCQGTAVELSYTATCGTGPFNLEIRQDAAATNTLYNGVVNGGTINITPTPVSQGSHTYDLMKITDANGCTNPVTP